MSHQVAIREEELKNRVAALYFGKYDCTRIFCTTNPLTAEVTFGTSRAFGPVAVTNKTLEVDLGHLLATNGEKPVMYFWDDANSNCVRDVEETFARQALPIRGHDNALTNRLSFGAFDTDNDEIPDWWEMSRGLSPPQRAQAALWPTPRL